jgi:hypothetical protein
MNLREAAQQALEALESCTPADTSTGHVVWPSYDEQAVAQAITALRTALAEPEQGPVQVTPIDFVTAVLGKEDCVGKPIMWAEWPNRAHGIGGEA